MDNAVNTGYAEILRVLRAYGGNISEDTLSREHHDVLVLLQLCAFFLFIARHIFSLLLFPTDPLADGNTLAEMDAGGVT